MNKSIRDSASALLKGQISRRSFMKRAAAIGLAPPVADQLLELLSSNAEASENSEIKSSGTTQLFHNLTGGELMAEFLRAWQTKYVFGVGGSEEVGFLDALVDRVDLQYVLALHEGAAVAMADGYARAVGQPALVNLHSVVGAGNAISPMVNAFKDRTPLVITVGRQSTQARGSEAFLEATNLHSLPSDYARWTWDVLRSDNIPDILRRAFLVSRVPPMGPTFLTFSKDLWEMTVDEAAIETPDRSAEVNNFQPDDRTIQKLADALISAEAPLLIAGRELNLYGGMEELAAVAELLGAAVMADVPASHSGINFPTTHQHYIGLFTLDSPGPDGFDLFWSVGGTMFTLFDKPATPLIAEGVKIVHASIDGSEIGRNYPIDLAAVGNVRLTLISLLDELKSRTLSSSAVERRKDRTIATHRDRLERLDQEARNVWDESPIAPERLAVELNQQLDPQCVIVSELATSDFFLWNHLDFHSPARKHVTSSGGALGWGIGAAIGTKMGYPHREVCLLVGDGSFQFGVQALWSAARFEVPIAVVIWNNNAYQANRRALHNYGRRAAATGKYIGTYLGAPDIQHVQIAQGYGIDGEIVSDPDELQAAIARCLRIVQEGASYVLDVRIQSRQGGADATWYDKFSIARNTPRAS